MCYEDEKWVDSLLSKYKILDGLDDVDEELDKTLTDELDYKKALGFIDSNRDFIVLDEDGRVE